MNPLRRTVFLLPLFFLLCVSALCHAQAYTSIVIFGDSLSDTGNFAHLSASSYGVRIPGPIAGYTDGRFTDGIDTAPQAILYQGVWIEQLAATLAAKPAIKNTLDGGTNYAYADAITGPGTQVITFGTGNIFSVTVKNVGQQIADYLTTNPTITNKTLFVVWSGANDVLQATTQAAVTTAAQTDLANVQALITAGATDILIPNLPPLGAIPRLNTVPANAAAASSASLAYNTVLLAGVVALPSANPTKTLRLFFVDNYSLFNSLIASPSYFGLSNVTQSSQFAVANPDTYLFWDDLHPTTFVHHLIGVNAKNVLTATSTASVTLALGATAALPGQAVTLSALIAPAASGTQPMPTGFVTFYSGSTAIATTALSASALATASLTAGAIVGSPYAITARYSGDATYITNTSPAASLTVVGTPVATSTTLSSSSNPSNLNGSVTFTASVSSTLASPTGTVTFLDGTTTLGTGTVGAGVPTATYTTNALTAGTHTITAVFGATATYGASTSPVVAQVVVTPSLTLSASPTTVTVASGSTATATLTLTPSGGITGTYTLGCTSLPAHLSCAYAPATLTFTGATTQQTSTLLVGTTASAALDVPLRPGRPAALQVLSAAFFLPGLGGLALLRRRRASLRSVPFYALILLSACAVTGLTGCGSASNKAASGTYQVVANATPSSGGTAVTLNLTVVVQ